MNKSFAPEQRLDLRTQQSAELSDTIASFLRYIHRRGVRQLLITFAPGPTTDEPAQQRSQAVVDALTQGAAAPLVRAFASPHENLGGTAALAVLLI